MEKKIRRDIPSPPSQNTKNMSWAYTHPHNGGGNYDYDNDGVSAAIKMKTMTISVATLCKSFRFNGEFKLTKKQIRIWVLGERGDLSIEDGWSCCFCVKNCFVAQKHQNFTSFPPLFSILFFTLNKARLRDTKSWVRITVLGISLLWHTCTPFVVVSTNPYSAPSSTLSHTAKVSLTTTTTKKKI